MKLIINNHAICFDACYGVYSLKYGPHSEETVWFESRQQAMDYLLSLKNNPQAIAQNIIESTQDLLITDSAGVYMPQIACQKLDICFENCQEDSKSICLEGPKKYSDEDYWEAWDDVLNYGTINGKSLHQNGDLWLIDYDKRSELIAQQGDQSEHIESLIEGLLAYQSTQPIHTTTQTL